MNDKIRKNILEKRIQKFIEYNHFYGYSENEYVELFLKLFSKLNKKLIKLIFHVLLKNNK